MVLPSGQTDPETKSILPAASAGWKNRHSKGATLSHPRIPGCGIHLRESVFEKVDDSFPWTCRKPLAAWTNSFNEGKRGVQVNLLIYSPMVTTEAR
jgi:hypothetical protein